jgi:hypothetical protein
VLLIEGEEQVSIFLQIAENDGRNGASDKVAFSPKLSEEGIVDFGARSEMLIQLRNKLDIFDAVGIQEGSAIVKVEQSFKINIEIVLVIGNECGCKQILKLSAFDEFHY